LGQKNQSVLLNVYQIDIINKKLKHNNTLNFIDHNIRLIDPSLKFINQTNSIDKEKMKKEGLWIRLIIFSLIIIGGILANQNDVGQYFIFAGLGLWAFNHFFPIFPETKKLRTAVSTFNKDLGETIGIKRISLQ